MPSRTTLPPKPAMPLLITGDPDLLDDMLRLGAAAGTELDVAADPIAARPRYARAPLVLIGIDQARACLRSRLPRRRRLVLVGRSDVDSAPWEAAELMGVEHVAVLPAAEPWLVDRLSEPEAGQRGRVVALVGGRGGAGASVLSVALALTAVRSSLRTLLVDADPLGGGLDLLLGWEELDGLRWPELSQADGRVDPPSLVRALPGRGDLVLLSWDRGELLNLPAHAMAATMDAGRRGRDLVVVDVPRQLDDAAVLALQAADR
ncbi:MAG TPA: septum site-determining protein Ssd, partial [Pilimelia sp.]|nr:septum site-determining protein Ssd [Pilimelia sp.]